MAVTKTRLPNEHSKPSIKAINGGEDCYKLVGDGTGGTADCEYSYDKFCGADTSVIGSTAGAAYTLDEANKKIVVTVAANATAFVSIRSAG